MKPMLVAALLVTVALLVAPGATYAARSGASHGQNACGAPSDGACVVMVDNPPGVFDDLQDAIDEADDGATITVTGVCSGSARIYARMDLVIEGVPPGNECPFTGPRSGDLTSTLKGGSHEGIKIRKSKNITVRFLNIIGAGSEGVEIESSEHINLACNCVGDSDEEGIEVDRGLSNYIGQNWVVENGDDGVVIKYSSQNQICGNTLDENDDDGIAVERDSEDNIVAGHWIRRNDEDGIDLDNTVDNQVIVNEVFENGRDPDDDSGVELRGAERNVVDGNDIRDNADGLVNEARCQRDSRDNTGSNVMDECGTTTPPPTTFVFSLSGEQEVPPTGSRATATCAARLSEDESTFSLTCCHEGCEQSTAAIYRGAMGENGVAVFDLGDAQGPIQANLEVTEDDVQDLLDGLWYVSIQCMGMPDIRGQVGEKGIPSTTTTTTTSMGPSTTTSMGASTTTSMGASTTTSMGASTTTSTSASTTTSMGASTTTSTSASTTTSMGASTTTSVGPPTTTMMIPPSTTTTGMASTTTTNMVSTTTTSMGASTTTNMGSTTTTSMGSTTTSEASTSTTTTMTSSTTTTTNEGKEVSGLSLRKVRMRAGRRDLSRGRYRLDGEIDVTATPGFLQAVLDTGVTVTIGMGGGAGGEVVETVFDPSDCIELRGGVRCVHKVVRSRTVIRFRPPFSPKFHKVAVRARRQSFEQPDAGDTPLMVHVESGLDVIERMDMLNNCTNLANGRLLRCKEIPDR